MGGMPHLMLLGLIRQIPQKRECKRDKDACKNVKRCCQSHDPTCSPSACEVSIKFVPITAFELFIHVWFSLRQELRRCEREANNLGPVTRSTPSRENCVRDVGCSTLCICACNLFGTIIPTKPTAFWSERHRECFLSSFFIQFSFLFKTISNSYICIHLMYRYVIHIFFIIYKSFWNPRARPARYVRYIFSLRFLFIFYSFFLSKRRTLSGLLARCFPPLASSSQLTEYSITVAINLKTNRNVSWKREGDRPEISL